VNPYNKVLSNLASDWLIIPDPYMVYTNRDLLHGGAAQIKRARNLLNNNPAKKKKKKKKTLL
jgi:hypothetical protein